MEEKEEQILPHENQKCLLKAPFLISCWLQNPHLQNFEHFRTEFEDFPTKVPITMVLPPIPPPANHCQQELSFRYITLVTFALEIALLKFASSCRIVSAIRWKLVRDRSVIFYLNAQSHRSCYLASKHSLRMMKFSSQLLELLVYLKEPCRQFEQVHLQKE